MRYFMTMTMRMSGQVIALARVAAPVVVFDGCHKAQEARGPVFSDPHR
jgi:hypothetical protein